jgi:hydroxylamine reductase
MFIPTVKCYPLIITRLSKNMIISQATTATHGGSRSKNLYLFMARFCSLLTVSFRQKKSEEVRSRIFTTGSTGYPGCKHIEADENGKKDFSEIIALAKTLPSPDEIETGSIVGGFAHNQMLVLADKVVDAVKSGAIKKFFVMAGCDGRLKSREYYTEFAEKLPQDTVILTAGCAKYRYNKLKLGDIGGIPRVLDAGV